MERRKISGQRLASALLGLYVIVLPFHRAVWRLPFFGDRIQPAELALALLVLYGSFLIGSGRVPFWFSPLDAPVLLWLAANLIANAFAGFNGHLLLETTKVAAVVLVYFSFRLLLTDDFLARLADILLLSAFIASLLAIAGSLLSLFGSQTVLTAQMLTYPYIGGIGRAMAFTSTPNMLGSILMTALLLKAACRQRAKKAAAWEFLATAVCLLAFIAAVSKTILCFFIGLLTLLLLRPGRKAPGFQFFAGSAMVLLALAYLIGSHLVFTAALTPRVRENMEQGHITRTYHDLGPLLAVETSYVTIKRSCWHVLKETFPLGVGTRNFKTLVPALKEKGIYNRETENFDPHCTPLGTLVEVGLLGGIALLLLYGLALRALLALRKSAASPFQCITAGMIALFMALSLEGWVTDIMNFRHYWLLLGVLAYMSRKAAAHAGEPAA